MAILFFVEGEEKRLIERICKKGAQFAPVSGGHQVSAEILADEYVSIVRQDEYFDFYILWTDLDKRHKKNDVSAVQFEAEIETAIRQRLTQAEQQQYLTRTAIAACDREFENWLLAAITGQDTDGDKCRQELETHIGGKYRKSIHLTRLYDERKLSFKAAMASSSFKRFAQKVPEPVCSVMFAALAR